MEIATNTVVGIRYVLKNAMGDILEDIMAKQAIEYLHGSGSFLPQLEKGLEGLPAGFSKIIKFNTAGDLVHEFTINVSIDSVRAATPAEIANGKPEIKQKNSDCGPGCCC